MKKILLFLANKIEGFALFFLFKNGDRIKFNKEAFANSKMKISKCKVRFFGVKTTE